MESENTLDQTYLSPPCISMPYTLVAPSPVHSNGVFHIHVIPARPPTKSQIREQFQAGPPIREHKSYEAFNLMSRGRHWCFPRVEIGGIRGKPLKRTLCNFPSGTGSDTKIEVAALSPCGTSKCQQGLNAHTHTPTRTPTHTHTCTHMQSPRPLQDLLGPGTGKEEPQWPRPPPLRPCGLGRSLSGRSGQCACPSHQTRTATRSLFGKILR